MRLLGVDFGTKRVGLAFADELLVAMPLAAAVQATEEERLAHLLKFVKERRVQEIVVGLPYNMDGTIGFKAKEAQVFAEKLGKLTGLPVHLSLDQRLDDARSWVETGLGHTLTETHHHRHRCLLNTPQIRAVGWRVHHRVRGFAINHPVRER